MNEWAQARKAFFFLTDFEAGQCLVETTDSLPVRELQFEFPDISHREKQKQTEMPEEIRWVMHPESFETYRRSFDIVRRNILAGNSFLLAGNSFLTNLTCQTPIETNLSLLQIFEHARARYARWKQSQKAFGNRYAHNKRNPLKTSGFSSFCHIGKKQCVHCSAMFYKSMDAYP